MKVILEEGDGNNLRPDQLQEHGYACATIEREISEIYDDIEEEYGNDINEEEESDEINDIGFANNHSFSLKQN